MMMNKNFTGLNKLRTILGLFIFAALTVYLGSCASSEIANSEDVNQKKIHQLYSVYFDANNGDNYLVESQFRFGGNKGTTLRLSDPSSVTVNGEEMDEESNVLRGCFYESSLSGKNKFEFVFKDTEEKEYKNSCEVWSAELKPFKEIYTENSLQIKWIGSDLKNNETITVTIKDGESNIATASTNVLGATYLIINPSDMGNILEGNAEAFFTRTYSSDLAEAADDGGTIYTEYISKKISIDIIKGKNPNE